MSICIPTPGSWSATSHGAAVLLAPVTSVVDATGLSAAVSVREFGGAGRGNAQAMPAALTHKYIDPGSPPRGRLR